MAVRGLLALSTSPPPIPDPPSAQELTLPAVYFACNPAVLAVLVLGLVVPHVPDPQSRLLVTFSVLLCLSVLGSSDASGWPPSNLHLLSIIETFPQPYLGAVLSVYSLQESSEQYLGSKISDSY